MTSGKYRNPKPVIPAEIQRTVEVEAGHSCSINHCNEHTYLEFHHINGDRNDNRVKNLILLCDMHHKMAHNGVIDRKALHQYKEALKTRYDKELIKRVERLEKLLSRSPAPNVLPIRPTPSHGDPDLPVKLVVQGPQLMAQVVEQLAISKYENEEGLRFERNARFSKSNATWNSMHSAKILTCHLT